MLDNRLVIAFDIDDTLIVPAIATGFDRDVPNYDNIAIYHWFQNQGAFMIIWSGGGQSYAEMWADKLGLVADEILDKHSGREGVDIAFDDADIKLARVNVQVKRINNQIVRYPERVKNPHPFESLLRSKLE